jgi:hypothetical protein
MKPIKRSSKRSRKVKYDLVLRTCDAYMVAYNGFQWPESGHVSAPDWDPKPECGHGLHGLLHGCGDYSYLSTQNNAKWLVVKVPKNTCVDIIGKVKFPEGEVIFAGSKDDAIKMIADAYPGEPVVYAKRMVGDNGVAVSGNDGTSISGNDGTSISGNYGTSISGESGTSTSGDRGTSTSGDRGTSTSGYYGTSTSGDYGTSISGIGGRLVIEWYDGSRYRLATAYVGENGIEPNVAYKLDDKGNFVKA